MTPAELEAAHNLARAGITSSAMLLHLVAEVRRLRAVAEAFASAAEAAVRAHETRSDGGMRVPFHGDFAGAQPSIIGRLRWWAREFRAALGQGVDGR